MSVIGSISNDASFNTWITDMTNTANRSKVDTILAVLPLLAIAVVFVGFDGLTNAAATTDDWKKFFMLLGIIPTVGGLIGVFLMKDKPGLQKKTDGNFLADFVYSLNPKVIKENKAVAVKIQFLSPRRARCIKRKTAEQFDNDHESDKNLFYRESV